MAVIVSMATAKPYIVFIITISYHLIDGVSMVLREPIGQIEVLKSWQDFEDLNESYDEQKTQGIPVNGKASKSEFPLAIWSRLDLMGTSTESGWKPLKDFPTMFIRYTISFMKQTKYFWMNSLKLIL